MKNLTFIALLALTIPALAADEASIKAYCEEEALDEGIDNADERAAFVAECVERNQAAGSWGKGSVTGK